MWPKFLRSYFGFTKQQGRGLFVLCCLCFFIVVIRLALPLFEPQPKYLLKNLPLISSDSNAIVYEKTSITSASEKKELRAFQFDPNTISFEQALQLGIKPGTAKALVNFRNKGFVFKEKNDLLKVYGFSKTDFERLAPYIIIQKQIPNTASKVALTAETSESQTQSVIVPIELNSADSAALVALNGIGPTFAKRILKYRALLGGFAEVNQLKEVYGFTEELLTKIQFRINVDPSLIHKLHLNSGDFKTLNRHPYLSYEFTQVLVNSRKIKPLNEATFKALLNDESLFHKLSPYCSYD